MDIAEKLRILSDAAKYDVSCSSSGSSSRSSQKGGLGAVHSCGICHTFTPDGRCVSLLKVLLSNRCIFDCTYCANAASHEIERASFTEDEIVNLTLDFYMRNYIEGLFLSSAVERSPDYTMERLARVLKKLRTEGRFGGYIHVKAIPGASRDLVDLAGRYADRMSVNIELPSNTSLELLAPQKRKESIVSSFRQIASSITENRYERRKFRHAPQFVPAGQSTQLIIGATPETDSKILTLSENLYKKFSLKRVFYSAYIPVNNHPLLPEIVKPPLLREHRLYQADWLLRYYHFTAAEILPTGNEILSEVLDPKCNWAIENYGFFPVDVNSASYYRLLRVPGIGVLSAKRIMAARKVHSLTFDDLRKLGVVMKRAVFFITASGKFLPECKTSPQQIKKLLEDGKSSPYTQLSLFDSELLPAVIVKSAGGQF